MIIFVFLLCLVIFNELKAAGKNEFHGDYISPAQTTAVNGIFTLLVFLSHAAQYIKLDGIFDEPYAAMKSHLGQMVVVTFLFYSGYGIMESIKKKGTAYVKDIPFKRFFKVLYHMAVAVSLFIILNLFLKREYDIKTVLLAFTGWKSIGNSNWYIFTVLVLYVITFISFIIFRKNNYLAVLTVTALSVCYVFVLMVTDTDPWYYNTAIHFALGMWFSLFREPIEKILLKNDLTYLCAFAATATLYCFVHINRSKGIEWYSLWGTLFMALIILVTMKIKIGNKILAWFGSHIFSVYVLQRIPMLILKQLNLNISHKYMFVVVSFFATIAMAAVFDTVIAKLDTIIYSRKELK